jgi:Zn-dependent protease
MDLEAFPLDLKAVFTSEAIDTRFANVAPRSYEVGVDDHGDHVDILSLYSRGMPGTNVSVTGLIITILAFLVAIDVHEFSHAFVAHAQGDVTAKQLGRLSLNPIRHLDPMGTLLLFIMVVAGFGIGWGKPVPVNPANLRNGRQSMALVSIAGVVANLVTAVLCGLILRSHVLPDMVREGTLNAAVGATLFAFVQALIGISIGLAVFNLLPIFPLDGFNVVVNVVPSAIGAKLAKYAHWGPGILMLLIFLPQLIPGLRNVNLLARILEPPFQLLEHVIVGS